MVYDNSNRTIPRHITGCTEGIHCDVQGYHHGLLRRVKAEEGFQDLIIAV